MSIVDILNKMTALKLDTVVPEDSAALANIWLAAFADPASRTLFPDTPGVRNWLESAISYDLLQRPFQHYVKIVDPSSSHRIAAYAKWDLSTAEERGSRYHPPWHADMPADLCEAFVKRGERNRERVMGKQKHLCIYIYLLLLAFFLIFATAKYFYSPRYRSYAPRLSTARGCGDAGEMGM